MERSCANLSVLLSENGYDVHLVVLNDDVDYEYKGQLFNLGKYKADNDTQFKRFLRFRKLRRYFRKQKFDYIIDNRIGNNAWREMYYILYIYGLRRRVVYMQHNGNLGIHMPPKGFLSQLLLKYAEAFVGVSEGISTSFNEKYQTTKCSTIYNYLKEIVVSPDDYAFPENYILYLGRLDDDAKNFKLMLESYKRAAVEEKIKLLIMGDGSDKMLLEKYIDEMGLSNDVILRPFSESVYQSLTKARFMLLTSRYEGFPMTIIEALSCGTPVVSVDCNTGPREIIRDEENGLLVENYDSEALATAIRRMVEDESLYQICKGNARKSIDFLKRENISKQWKTVLA